MSVTHQTTIEQLWAMPEKPGVRYELADGELIEVPGAGYAHSLISGLIYRLLYGFATERRLGVVLHDGATFILQSDPPRARIPDVSFISAANVPAGEPPSGFWPTAPDLAVEIVSPSDRGEDVRAKATEYLDGGSRCVWVLWPEEESVSVYVAGEPVQSLESSDVLEGGELLPGLSVLVRDLFDVRNG